MYITITKVKETKGNQMKVQMESGYGNAWVTWQGIPPKVGLKYSVELSIPSSLIWGEDIYPTNEHAPCIKQEESNVKLYGKLIKVENDGVAVIQIGDSVLLLDTEPGIKETSKYVCIRTTEIKVFDTNV